MAGKQNFLEFYNGRKMPIIGLGTWQASLQASGEEDEREIITAVDAAIEAGYRHIDTAYLYCTERAIGKTLKKWFDSGKIKREDVFITTKLPSWAMRADRVENYLKESLEALQLKYVDLYLLHHPVGLVEIDGDNVEAYFKNPVPDATTDHISVWEAMEAQVDAGRTVSIGLSNFNARQIKRIVNSARIKPANLQVETQVYFQQKELVAFCRALDITVCAFGPIGSPALGVHAPKEKNVPNLSPLSDPVVNKIAKRYNRPPAQILLRHLIQHGIAVIPKSSKPERIKQNFQVLNFELNEEEMDQLDALDKGRKGRIFTETVMCGMWNLGDASICTHPVSASAPMEKWQRIGQLTMMAMLWPLLHISSHLSCAKLRRRGAARPARETSHEQVYLLSRQQSPVLNRLRHCRY